MKRLHSLEKEDLINDHAHHYVAQSAFYGISLWCNLGEWGSNNGERERKGVNERYCDLSLLLLTWKMLKNEKTLNK